MLACIWCNIFPYCSTASCLVSDMIWDSLFEETQVPDIKVGGVLCWELEPLFFNLFLFSSIFFRTFPLFSLSLPQLLSCLCVYLFLHEAWYFHDVLGCELITVKVTAWYKRESIIDVSENWASDFLSLISEKYHVLPFNSSTSHFVDNTNISPFWLG